jgi:hypothetical protein
MALYNFLAVLSAGVQLLFISIVIRQNRIFQNISITSADIEQINDEVDEDIEFEVLNDLSEVKSDLFADLRWNIGHSSGLGFIEKLVYRYYSPPVNTINHYGNLGPAFGLIFTFIGMILTFSEISGSNISDQSHVKTIILSMSPVIVGSLFGIITYAVARIVDNRISKIMDWNIVEITKELKLYDDEVIPENIEDAYEKILTSLTSLRSELKGVTANISDYSQAMGKSNQTFEDSVSSFGNISSELVHSFTNAKDKMLGSNTDIIERFGAYATSIDLASKDIAGFFQSLHSSNEFMKDLMNQGISFTKSVKLSGKAISTLIDTTENQNKASETLISATENFSKIQIELSKVTLDIKEIHETSQSVATNIETISQLFPVNTFNDMRIHLQSIGESIEQLVVTLTKTPKMPEQPSNSLAGQGLNLPMGDTKYMERLLKQQLDATNNLSEQMRESAQHSSRFRNIFLPIGILAIITAILVSSRYSFAPSQDFRNNTVRIDSLMGVLDNQYSKSDTVVEK